MAADSRTNAGVDYVSTYQKLFNFSRPGDRVIVLSTAGSLSISQALIGILQRDIKAGAAVNLHSLPTLYDVARYVGDSIRTLQDKDRPWLEKDNIEFKCSFLLGGQIQGEASELYMIYSQGNFIRALPDTPFLQIGETKYGKPILDRILSFETPVAMAAKCALLSIDSTMKANVSVGPPINLIMYEHDSFKICYDIRLKRDSPYLRQIRKMWERSLKEAFKQIPDINWEHYLQASEDGE
jgi:putative proteasome-type protease